MYTFSDAAHLAGVSSGTVRNWVLGCTVQPREVEPLFTPRPGQGPMVSFLQLIEIMLSATLRKAQGAKCQTVRQAYINAQKEFDLAYPFAHLKLEAIGGHIAHLIQRVCQKYSLQAVDQPGQWTLPGLVQEAIAQIKYEEQLAAQWYPERTHIPIVIDPRISTGMPTIVGRSFTISTIHKRFKEGRLYIDFIAKDYRLVRDQVEQAIRYAEQLAA